MDLTDGKALRFESFDVFNKKLDPANPDSHGKYIFYQSSRSNQRQLPHYYITWNFAPKDAAHEWQISFTAKGLVQSNNLGEFAYWDLYNDDVPAELLKTKVIFPEGIVYDTVNPVIYRGFSDVKMSNASDIVKPIVVEEGKAVTFELTNIAEDERINLALGIAPGVLSEYHKSISENKPVSLPASSKNGAKGQK